MKTILYYFSATGNSLSITRKLSSELGNCEIVPIAKAIKEETVEAQTDKVGFIFPVYAWGMPRIISEFIQKINISKDSYVFAIASCVAIQGNTLRDLKNELQKKGINLKAGFVVSGGRSSLMNLNMLDKIIIAIDRQRNKIKSFDERMTDIVKAINNNERRKIETSSFGANIFGSMFHNMAIKSFASIDSQFIVGESCKGCGNCAKICPRSNILLENNRPSFKNNCEFCHSCIQWCPNFSIKHPNFDSTLKQYRNPEIKLKDMMI